ncbi:ATP-dependent transcriptional regulator [Pseudomonas sp. UL073]|uniref:ATP-dependent transcriptional regulator n=1 Tax=Zestomonas insulae TaxID=2809017 RepID=A0ABS2IDX9_9GAMM|nr:LuxR C-terminal-related transcriptional regulator [Pseudomonas insulae]MBM7061301.1 ATP-dependent transcriptional regulator [Pseudomonas insulae]
MQGLGFKLALVRGNATCIPPLPVAHLSRPRLLHALQQGAPRLRLLCGTAGFGKSVLASEYLSQLAPGERVVWIAVAGQRLTLDELSRKVAAELDLEHPMDGASAALLSHFESRKEPLWLVFDDLPNELSAETNAWFDRLLALPSSPLQLLVTCRQRPRWNLPRLMLRGELMELDCGQLSFTHDEFEALLGLLAQHLETTAREQLWQQTQGWCAGIRLLLPADHVATPLLWLREYLEHEVLARLGDAEREMLFGLAHLPRASAELCAQLWDELDGSRLFKRLVRQHLFLVPVDRQGRWYRLLPAVACALQDHLSAAQVNRLRLRSCQLLSRSGHLNEAIDQALGAEQPEVAANYMEQLQRTWLLSDRHLTQLLGWRERVPPQLLESTPRLVNLCARALLFSGRLEEAQACLQRLAHFLPQPEPLRNTRLLATWQALEGAREGLLGNAQAARRHCLAALSQFALHDWLAMLLCYSTLARIAMAGGELAQAEQYLLDALELTRRHGFQDGEILINIDRFRLMILQGELRLAETLVEEDVQRLELASCGQQNPLLGRLLFLRSELRQLSGAFADSEADARTGLRHVQNCSAPFILHGYLLLSELAVQRGEKEQALLHLHEGERRMHWGKIDSACYQYAITWQRMRVLAGQGLWAELLPIAKALEEELRGWPQHLPALAMPSLLQRNQLLLARAELALGERSTARRRLTALLEQCQQLQFELLAGEVQQLLAQLGGRLAPRGAADPSALLAVERAAADEAAPAPPAVAKGGYYQDDLTPRELSVLKLLAEGLSNQEVGDSLFISVNTVKSHAKNINTKLGTTRRTQAIMHAKSMGLLG